MNVLGKPVEGIRDGIYKAIGAAIVAGVGSMVLFAHVNFSPKPSGGYLVAHTYNAGYYEMDIYNPGYYETDFYNQATHLLVNDGG